MRNEKGSVPVRYWIAWWLVMALADFVFYVLLTPIEFVSTFIVRPVTLAIRLLANMIAGHLILSVFFVATGYMLTSLNFSMVFGIGSLIFSVALIAFELFVAGLQAYVFTILSAVYIAGALEPEH